MCTSAWRSSSGRPLAAAAAARWPSARRPVRAGGAPSGWKAALPCIPASTAGHCGACVVLGVLGPASISASAESRLSYCRSSCCRLTVASVTTLWVVKSPGSHVAQLLFGAGGSSDGGCYTVRSAGFVLQCPLDFHLCRLSPRQPSVSCALEEAYPFSSYPIRIHPPPL